MISTTKTYVEYLYPGIMFPESEVEEVQSRDPFALNPPANCYAFSFFDRTFATLDDGTQLISKAMNESCRYYNGGEVVHWSDIPDDDSHRILRSNAEGNGWNYLVKCPQGNWQPFEAGDVLIGRD